VQPPRETLAMPRLMPCSESMKQFAPTLDGRSAGVPTSKPCSGSLKSLAPTLNGRPAGVPARCAA